MYATDKGGRLITALLGRKGDRGSYNIPLNRGEGAGPAFYLRQGERRKNIPLKEQKDASFRGSRRGIGYELSYSESEGGLRIRATLKNGGNRDFTPETCGLKLGIDSWMESFPSWNKKLFPTHLRCEKTHFSSYLMSPDGDILAIGSAEPIASWSLDYNGGGHRIRTMNLDLLNAPPLPSRHPENCSRLKAGEERTWIIEIRALSSMDEIPSSLASLTQAPWIEMKQTSIAPGEEAGLKIHLPGHPADECRVRLISPGGEERVLQGLDNEYRLTDSAMKPGLHRITAELGDRRSESTLYVRRPWSWYMTKARDGALKHYQHATTHCESLYGFYTLFRSQRFLPDRVSAKQAEERWNIVFPQVFDRKPAKALIMPGRIQNTAAMINILSDRYRISGDPEDLETALGLARRLIEGHQHPDGSYRNGTWGQPEKGVHYTAVIYPAMNIMELMDLLSETGGELRKQHYSYLYDSVRRAMDELERNLDNIDTEGELTFEDGMISCSAAQMSRFALMQSDREEQKRYRDAALKLLHKHRCLTQLKTPDARQRGGTLRYWEAQYDIITFPNMMNSPHGWSSWRSYALYYLYLLTGEADLLEQLMNVMGSCMQVIHEESGSLRWAFIADPYIRSRRLAAPVKRFSRDRYNKLLLHHLKLPGHKTEKRIIGEEFLAMNSSWQFGNPNDNDVHEHFRALAEIALTQAFVLETDRGYKTWNGSLREEGDRLIFRPAEEIVERVHLNLKTERRILLETESGDPEGSPMKFGWLELN